MTGQVWNVTNDGGFLYCENLQYKLWYILKYPMAAATAINTLIWFMYGVKP